MCECVCVYLPQINANVLCDTHKAIKCVCDGQPKTMEAKAESLKTRAQEELAAQAEKGDANTVRVVCVCVCVCVCACVLACLYVCLCVAETCCTGREG